MGLSRVHGLQVCVERNIFKASCISCVMCDTWMCLCYTSVAFHTINPEILIKQWTEADKLLFNSIHLASNIDFHKQPFLVSKKTFYFIYAFVC